MNTLVLDPTQDPGQDLAPARGRHTNPLSHPAPCFHHSVDGQGVCWLVFDQPGSSANVWNEATLREFDDHLEEIGHDPTIRALVIRSAKERIFIAGADLRAMRSLPPARLEDLMRIGQEVFEHLASLPIPKVALVHGACLGGGFEMALACDHRIASDSALTKIGLPEVRLGLIPGWGGCTRLPRLVGLPRALDLILNARVLSASSAKRQGLVDEVLPREHLEAAAARWCRAPGPARRRRLRDSLLSVAPLKWLVLWKAGRDLGRKTRGLYAAPVRALQVMRQGIGRSKQRSLELERVAVSELARAPETARLIHLFFQKEDADKKPAVPGHALPVHEAVVIGAGVMGAGIAHWLVSHGVRVLMTDVNPAALATGSLRVKSLLDDGARKHALSRKEARDSMDRLSLAHERVPLARYPLVIEAATEDLELKKKIFADLASRCAPDTILATNTSALSVAGLASCVPNPERVIGLHFFNPVHRMMLVEVIRHAGTSEDALATAAAFVQRIGKTPVIVRNSPGFIVNRVLMPYLMEAARLYETGAGAREIDEAMLDFGMPMGPMRLLDEIGLDVAAHVARTLGAAFPERVPSTTLLDRMIGAGFLGKKSGQGFYRHKADGEAMPVRAAKASAIQPAEIQERLTLALANEAARCAGEGVARNVADVDLAMVLGAGYPPFIGGPISWIEACGRENVAADLRSVAARTPAPHPFDPAPMLSRDAVGPAPGELASAPLRS